MVTKIQRWGNSLGLRIPKAVAQDAHIQEGTTVDLRIEDSRLVIRPIRSDAHSLSDLLAQVTADNIHAEVDFGKPVGKEIG